MKGIANLQYAIIGIQKTNRTCYAHTDDYYDMLLLGRRGWIGMEQRKKRKKGLGLEQDSFASGLERRML